MLILSSKAALNCAPEVRKYTFVEGHGPENDMYIGAAGPSGPAHCYAARSAAGTMHSENLGRAAFMAMQHGAMNGVN